MITIGDYSITSLETIDAFNHLTGAFLFCLDELQNATIAQTEDKQEITGKQGRKITSLKRNKAVTISGTNGMISGGLMEMQTGNTFKNGVTTVMWSDYVKVGAGSTATIAYTPVGTAGAEIIGIDLRGPDGMLAGKFTQKATASASGEFKYDSKTITFFEGDVKEGDEIVVYYKRKISADVLENRSDKFSGKCSLYINAMVEDKCGNIYRAQIYVPKADFNGEFSMEMGDNQTVHNFEAEALAGSCGNDGLLWTYTIYGANTTDVA